jgi:hypothetical protein
MPYSKSNKEIQESKVSGFKMKGMSFGNSPLHNDEKWVEKQLAKADKLFKRADAIEEAEKRDEFHSIFYSADRARKRAKIAKAKATAGSREAYRKSK